MSVQELLKQNVCTGSAETKCLYRNFLNKMYVQEVLKQYVCTGTAGVFN